MRVYSFKDWLDLYSSEVDHIISSYIDLVMNSFTSENTSHSFDINKFSIKMKKLIYDTSINKEKGSILYL